MKETKFKDTEVGRIPEDWTFNTIEKVATITTGSQNTQDNNPSGKYTFYVRSQQVEHIDSWIFETEGVVTAGDGVGTGKVFHYVNGKFGLHQRCYLIHQFKEIIDAKFFYWMFSNSFYERVHSMTAKSSVDSVRREMIADMLMPIPSKIEQIRIAQALTAIDNLISELGKLIEKKRAIKQGAMQQLLTGKKRLKGFNEPWVEKPLKEICSFQNGYTPSKAINRFWENGRIPWFRMEDIRTDGRILADSIQHITEEAAKGSLFPAGSIIMSTTATIGEHALLIVDSLANQQFTNLTIRKSLTQAVDTMWFYHYCFVLGEWCRNNINEGGLAAVNMEDFSNVIIPLPSFDEQKAIAIILSSMDKEISAFETKREKYNAIKQGMMQQLLTGKIRLVETAVRPNATSANVHFRRSVWAAEIAERLYEEPTFGHVKMEKMLFLTERLCHIDIGSHYHRDAAGPYDNNALRSIDSQLKKQKWFEVQRTEKGYRYVPMQNRGKHKTYFNRYYSGVVSMFDKIINTFKTQNTERCEIVATLYSAWEDLLHSNKSFTDADIVNEVLNNWHESKKRISQDRWLKAIQWMRDNGFFPDMSVCVK